jgi:hypothetical protein
MTYKVEAPTTAPLTPKYSPLMERNRFRRDSFLCVVQTLRDSPCNGKDFKDLEGIPL